MVRAARFAGGPVGRFLYRYLDASLRLIMPAAYGDRRKLTRAIHRQYRAVFPDPHSRDLVLWRLARALLASRPHYAELEQQLPALRELPVQIVWGLRDSALRPAQLERWRTAVPHARAVTLAAAGHWPHEEDPAAVIATLRDFLSQGPSA
jgi:haloalkane dehalogenase